MKELKEFTTNFFYWWYNAKGNNTEQGYDEFIESEGKNLYEQCVKEIPLDALVRQGDLPADVLLAEIGKLIDIKRKIDETKPQKKIIIESEIKAFARYTPNSNAWIIEDAHIGKLADKLITMMNINLSK